MNALLLTCLLSADWYALQGTDRPGQIPDSALKQCDGLSVRVSWKATNPSKGVYYWGDLDRELSRCKRLGKKMQVRVMCGPWAPGWLKSVGVQYMPSANGEIPVPYDPQLLANWRIFCQAFGKRYRSDSAITVWHLSGSVPNSAEWHWAAHTGLYSRSDYTDAKLTAAVVECGKAQAAAFPRAIISANLADCGRPWAKDAIAQLKTKLGQRAGFQMNAMSAKLAPRYDAYRAVVDAGASYPTGYQMLCASNQPQFGGTWEAMLAKIPSEADWVEVYQGDVSKPRGE